MLSKSSRWLFFAFVFIAIFAAGALTLPKEVLAFKPAPFTADNSCLSCHEDLYYLHDTGCWYCMSDAHKDRCDDCHEGNPSAVQEEVAHIGLLKHPQENAAAKCLECHSTEETTLLLEKFKSNQGFDAVIRAKAYTPSVPAKTGFPDIAEANPFMDNLGWLVFAILLFSAWLFLVLKP